MRISKLRLEFFRNLAPQCVSFDSQVSLIVGRNGEGKTNLLEAVYLLAQGSSFRPAKPKDFEQWNKPAQAITRVFGEIETESGDKTLAYEVRDGKRQILLNDKRVTLASAFYGQLCAIEFTPDDLQVVKGAPSERRSLLDSVLSMTDGAYVDELVHYQRALKHRNALLVQHAKGGFRGNIGEQLRPWDETLVKSGLLVSSKRAELIERLSGDFRATYLSLLADGNEKNEQADISYRGQFFADGNTVSHDVALAVIRERLERDVRTQKTNAGVQRDDIYFSLSNSLASCEARAVASQGQARSITLAFKLAAAKFVKERVGEAPVLLLDDVESELDLVRKEALLQRVFELGCQVLISATEVSTYLQNHISQLAVFSTSGGRVERI